MQETTLFGFTRWHVPPASAPLLRWTNGARSGKMNGTMIARLLPVVLAVTLTLFRAGASGAADMSKWAASNDSKLKRKIALTIEELDYVHNDVPHSLQFHWVVDGGTAPGTDMHYIYSPGRGLVSLDLD